MALAIASSNPNKIIYALTTISSKRGRERNKRPPIFVSTNPSHINIETLYNLYRSCNHSPNRFLAGGNFDARKLALAVAHSSVVVSVFAEIDCWNGGGEERDNGFLGRIMLPPARVTPESGEFVGFGRAVSDLGLTASIYDVMVIPSLQRLGIGRMIIQRIIRMLTNRGIYDISALCSEKERLFFEACGFGDDLLGSTTMIYTVIR